jgi:hypothetical protein
MTKRQPGKPKSLADALEDLERGRRRAKPKATKRRKAMDLDLDSIP